jgi:hypothetical protein
VQLGPGENVPPASVELKLTLPVGDTGLVEVSTTVAVQVVCVAAGSVEGSQSTLVVVARSETVSVVVPVLESNSAPVG